MNVEDFFDMPGKAWPAGSDSALGEWLVRVMLDTHIRFAYGWTHIAYTGCPQQNDLALALAQDVVQNKYIEIVRRSYRTYDPARYKGKQCPFRNWLKKIIARAAIKESKRKAAQLKREQKYAEEQARCMRERQINPPPLDPGLDWEQLWELGLIQPFVAQLLPKYREAIELRYKEGLTCAGAAQRASCSKGAMKVRLHRAHHELLALIQKEGGLL